MQPVTPDDLLGHLRWRYAVKKFDAARSIPEATWAALEESLVLSSSSYGLQPWKFFVVRTPETRARLLPHSWGQKQVVDASHLVVFALKDNVGAADAERLARRTAEVQGVPLASTDGYRKMVAGALTSKPQTEVDIWMTLQVYIALGHFLTAAALLNVDTCPMEGFVSSQYDEILGLKPKGYRSVVLATAGYRSIDDAYAQKPKVRFAAPEVVEYL